MEESMPDTVNRITRMDDIASELWSKYGELAELESAETQGRFSAWMGVDSTSVTERDRWASVQVLNLTSDIIKIKGEIRSLEHEYNHLKFRLSLSIR